jgi:hypothetical protein
VRSVLKTIIVCVSIFAVAGVLSAQTTTTTSTSSDPPFPKFNPPPCDFSDKFYAENGFDTSTGALNSPAAGRFGLFRLTGPPATGNQQNWVNDQKCGANDPTRNQSTDNPPRSDVRILATTGAYKDDDGAPTQFFSLIAFLLNQNFFLSTNFFGSGTSTCPACNVRGFRTIDIVGNFEAYTAVTQKVNGVLAPSPCGTMGDGLTPCFPVTSVATPNLRQDWRISSNRNAIDGSSNGPRTPFGYFCDDLTGSWIVTYFWYTKFAVGGRPDQPTPTANCQKVLAAAAAQNGTNLDGTPIIHTGDELHFLEGVPGTPSEFGLPTNDLPPAKAPCGAEGNEDVGGADGGAVWLICPTILDPRNGAIAKDAFLDSVHKPDGTPLDPRFTNTFNCLQNTGLFCNGT